MNPQDPLAQLNDIHLPDPVGWWPLAWGWWVLIALLLITLGVLLWRWQVQRRRQRYRQEALAVLRYAYRRYQDSDDTGAARVYLQTISELLRRTAISALPEDCHNDIAALNGHRWLGFLDATAPVDQGFTQGPGRVLAEGPYQPNPSVDVEGLNTLADTWIKRHKLTRGSLHNALQNALHKPVTETKHA